MAISNEYSPIEKVIVSSGRNIPEHHGDNYQNQEFLTFHKESERWDRGLLTAQQDFFFDLLRAEGAEVLYAEKVVGSPFQIFTRDIGFVVGNTFFYNLQRTLGVRNQEYAAILPLLEKCPEIEQRQIPQGKLEGGDVLVAQDELFIGISDRTSEEAIAFVEQYHPVRRIFLGPKVMHLDTRMALLPNGYMLICREAFQPADLAYLEMKYEPIPVTPEEANSFGTNILFVNPDLAISHSGHERIKRELLQRGFRTQSLDYSEPHVLLGSFHCTTLPLSRR